MKINGTLELYLGTKVGFVDIAYEIDEKNQITLLNEPYGMNALGSDGRRSYSKAIFDAIKEKHPKIFEPLKP